MRLRAIWREEIVNIEAPASATVGALRPLLSGHPRELWIGTRRFRDDEPVGSIPNGSTLREESGPGRPVPEVEEGRLSLLRPPRLVPLPLPPPVAPPDLPRPSSRRARFRWAAALVPLFAGIVLAVVFGPTMAAFSLLGVLMAVGSWIDERMAVRHDRRAAQEATRHALARYRSAEATRRRKTEAILCSRLPGPLVVADYATARRRELWERRPRHVDFGTVSIGESVGIPIGLTLEAGTTIGISGPAALGMARWVVVQAAVHHGPADVAIRGPSTSEWSWLEWLPHPESGAALDVALGESGGPGTCGIVVVDHPDSLPGACDVVIVAGDKVEVARMDRAEIRSGSAITVSSRDAAEIVQALACLHDPEAPAADAGVPLEELLGAPTASSIGEDWMTHDDGLVARLGTTRSSIFDLDLIGDGPHGLVAGTTGSGKSELLRSLVMSLAIRYPPERVVFVLVDFKGGATFDPCVRLPHVAGFMTDLDASGAGKILEALEAELREREQHLRDAGVGSLEPDDVRMPRLVVVVDEFGVLADQAPATLDSLVDLARRGRSLGIHLLLATQRPAGVISDSIRANTSIRIALRVNNRADAQDVIGADDAAHIDRRAPGLGFARLGPRELLSFSTAFVSGTSGGISVTSESKPPARRASDLDRLVDTIRRAAGSKHRRARPVWSEKLPSVIRADDLHAEEGVAIGMVDDPRTHRPLIWNGGNILVVDPEGDDAARALAGIATAASPHGTHLHIAGVRRGSPLWELDSVAVNIVGVGEDERAQRLVCYLTEELDRRRLETTNEPRVLFIVEDFRTGEELERIVAEGPAVGIGVVAAIRHAGSIGGTLLAGFTERLAFRLLDPYEYLALGIGSMPDLPKGAAISMAHQRVVRVVEPVTGLRSEDPGTPRIEALPNRVPLSTVNGTAVGQEGILFIPVGIGGRSTIGLTGPTIGRGRHLVITGPAGSGKSTALRAISASLDGAALPGAPTVDLVDDAHMIDVRPQTDGCLVIAARAGDTPHGHWVRRLASDSVGLCLQPDHRDEEFWRTRLPEGRAPGRGVILERGKVVPIQIASGTMHAKQKEDQCEFG